MTQLTYTIARIRVGAKFFSYWEKVEGFLNGNFVEIIIPEAFFEWQGYYTFEGQGYYIKIEGVGVKRNKNHLLSPLAEKLGAMLFGGFEDEKDFYLVMPTVDGLKIGDCIFYPEDNYRWVISYFNGLCSSEPQNKAGGDKPSRLNKVSIDSFIEDGKEGVCVIRNIFQEYARTGILENELYKQFFK